MSAKACRTCYWFKRRAAVYGTCWLPATNEDGHGAKVTPEHVCDWHKRKVERTDDRVSEAADQ
jgi:hypothetical protein